MEQLLEIRWHGRGGQGVVTAGKVLAAAALEANMFFQAFPDYGPERSGAPIRAYTRLDSTPIVIHNQIEEPDVVLVLDPTILGSVNVTEGLKEDGILIINTPKSPQEMRSQLKFEGGRVFTVDASHIAIEELGREITNAPMLGALAQATGIVALGDIVTQTRRWFEHKLSPAMVEANVRAIERAANQVQEG